MKRKLILLIVAMLLALTVSVGTYAYTYTTATATLDITAAGGPIVTSEPASDPPDWDSLLPVSEYDTEILLPNAAGADTKIEFQYPDSGDHWDKVADTGSDDWSAYVYTDSKAGYAKDLYQLVDHVEGTGIITQVTVYIRFAGDAGTTHING